MDFVIIYRYLETWKLYISGVSRVHFTDMDLLLEDLRSIPHEAMLRPDYHKQLYVYLRYGIFIIYKFYYSFYGETPQRTIEKWEGRVRALCKLHGFGHHVHSNTVMTRHVLTPCDYQRLRMTHQELFAAVLFKPVFEIDDNPCMY